MSITNPTRLVEQDVTPARARIILEADFNFALREMTKHELITLILKYDYYKPQNDKNISIKEFWSSNKMIGEENR